MNKFYSIILLCFLNILSINSAEAEGSINNQVIVQKLNKLSDEAKIKTQNSGYQDYFYRLCDMNKEADELKSFIFRSSVIFYNFYKLKLNADLEGFKNTPIYFDNGIKEAKKATSSYSDTEKKSMCLDSEVMREATRKYQEDALINKKYEADIDRMGKEIVIH